MSDVLIDSINGMMIVSTFVSAVAIEYELLPRVSAFFRGRVPGRGQKAKALEDKSQGFLLPCGEEGHLLCTPRSRSSDMQHDQSSLEMPEGTFLLPCGEEGRMFVELSPAVPEPWGSEEEPFLLPCGEEGRVFVERPTREMPLPAGLEGAFLLPCGEEGSTFVALSPEPTSSESPVLLPCGEEGRIFVEAPDLKPPEQAHHATPALLASAGEPGMPPMADDSATLSVSLTASLTASMAPTRPATPLFQPSVVCHGYVPPMKL